MTDKAELIEQIKEVIATEGMIDISKITPEATIESLDLKSVDIVMILTALEEKFNVYIPMDGSLQTSMPVRNQFASRPSELWRHRSSLNCSC